MNILRSCLEDVCRWFDWRRRGLIALVVGVGMASGVALGQNCPGAPGNVTASGRACTVRVTWVPHDYAPVQWFVVYRSSTLSYYDSVEAGRVSGSTTTYLFDDLNASPGVNYRYWVMAQGLTIWPYICPNPGAVDVTYGWAPATRVDISISPAPSVAATCGGVVVNWTLWPDASGVWLRRSKVGVAGFDADLGVRTGTTFTDATAVPGTSYTYSAFQQTPCGNSSLATASGAVVATGHPTITQEPNSAAVNIGTLASLTCRANAADVAYRWYRDGVALVDGGNVYNAGTRTLTIYPVSTNNVGVYHAVAANACGSDTTQDVVLAVRVLCRADFNASGQLTVDDIFDYLNAWFAGCP